MSNLALLWSQTNHEDCDMLVRNSFHSMQLICMNAIRQGCRVLALAGCCTLRRGRRTARILKSDGPALHLCQVLTHSCSAICDRRAWRAARMRRRRQGGDRGPGLAPAGAGDRHGGRPAPEADPGDRRSAPNGSYSLPAHCWQLTWSSTVVDRQTVYKLQVVTSLVAAGDSNEHDHTCCFASCRALPVRYDNAGFALVGRALDVTSTHV